LSDLIKSFGIEEELLRIQIAEICFHMGGGVEYNSAWGMSFSDREIMIKVINKKLKEQSPNGKEYL
jgi:hypothetical protein